MSRNQKKAMPAGFKRLFNSKHGKAVYPRAMKDELQFEEFLPFVSLQADDKTILTRSRDDLLPLESAFFSSLCSGFGPLLTVCDTPTG